MDVLTPLILDTAIKATAILSFAALWMIVWRGGSSARRYQMGAVAMSLVLFLPVMSVLLPTLAIVPTWPGSEQTSIFRASADALAQSDEMVFASSRFGDTAELAKKTGSSTEIASDQEVASSVPAAFTEVSLWRVWLPWIWMAGVVLSLLPVGRGVFNLMKLRRASEPVTETAWLELLAGVKNEMGLDRSIVLRHGPVGAMPMTWGGFPPCLERLGLPGVCATVLVPRDSVTWSDERRRVVLLHELSHVQRYDFLMQWIYGLTCALHWFSPLTWFLAHRLMVERERACDDRVLDHHVKASAYAHHLLALATGYHRLAPPIGLAMTRADQFDRRLQAILNPRRPRVSAGWRGLTMIVLGLGGWSASVAMLQAKPAEEAEMPVVSIEPDETPPAAAERHVWRVEMRMLLLSDEVFEKAREHVGLSENAGARLVDDLESKLLLDLSRQDSASLSLTAPTLTVGMGESAEMKIARETSYLASYEQRGDLWVPTLEQTWSGLFFQAQGEWGEGRLRLTLEPEIRLIRETSRSRMMVIGDQSRRVEEPSLTVWQARETALLPQHGTLLIVGPRVQGKMFTESGEASAFERHLVLLAKASSAWVLPDAGVGAPPVTDSSSLLMVLKQRAEDLQQRQASQQLLVDAGRATFRQMFDLQQERLVLLIQMADLESKPQAAIEAMEQLVAAYQSYLKVVRHSEQAGIRSPQDVQDLEHGWRLMKHHLQERRRAAERWTE